jgi:hypothetical protein
MTNKRSAAAVLLTLGVAGLLAGRAPADDKPFPKSAIADADLAGFVNQRIEAWKPTADERRFDDIAWVGDIREALKLARQHGRPVFLFTHDGRMNIGRC